MPVLENMRHSTAIPAVAIAVWLNGMVLDNALALAVRHTTIRLLQGPIEAQLDAILYANPLCGPGTPANRQDQQPMAGCHAVCTSDPKKLFAKLNQNKTQPLPEPT